MTPMVCPPYAGLCDVWRGYGNASFQYWTRPYRYVGIHSVVGRCSSCRSRSCRCTALFCPDGHVHRRRAGPAPAGGGGRVARMEARSAVIRDLGSPHSASLHAGYFTGGTIAQPNVISPWPQRHGSVSGGCTCAPGASLAYGGGTVSPPPSQTTTAPRPLRSARSIHGARSGL